MPKLTHNGTDGRTYGGDPSLVHIPDHHRATVGREVANHLEGVMRLLGELGVGHEAKPATGDDPLCPGCYMIALFDAAVFMADRTGQDVRELGASMAGLFNKLAAEGKYQATEEMTVIPAPAVAPVDEDGSYTDAPAVEPCAMARALERATLPANFGEA